MVLIQALGYWPILKSLTMNSNYYNAVSCFHTPQVLVSASLELIEQGNWQQQTQQIETLFSELLPKLETYDLVKSTRWLGAIGVVETHRPVNMETIQALFVEHGVWIRPFGKLIYMMPPFISKPDEIEKLVNAIDAALQREDCFA